jgi:hypothetical protein
MKKLPVLIVLLYLLAFLVPSVFSQDTIYLTNKEKIIALVTEISDSEIRFKEFSNPNGPDFIVKKTAIDHIAFKNGEQKQFIKEKRIIPYGRNILSYHLFDIVYQDFAISYEHILKNGMVGFKVPLSVGFNNHEGSNGPFQYKNLAYTGLGVNVYVTGQRMASYFMGPELQFGIGEEDDYYYDGYYEEYSETQFFYGKLLINNGFSFSPIQNMRIATVLGIGVRYFDIPESEESGVKSAAYFTFTMGYRF